VTRLRGKIVVPGDPLPEEVRGPEEYLVKTGKTVTPAVVGLLEPGSKPSFVPLTSIYIPSPGDIVIGLIESQGVMNWFVDINSPYQAILNIQDFLKRQYNPAIDDLSRFLQIGDYVVAKVQSFDRTRNPVLTVAEEGLGRIVEGKVVEVSPAKVPRVIGRKGSMVNSLKELTGCDFLVAVNGRIHVKCPNEDVEAIAILAIKMIEREAHTVGLTNRVKRFIEEERKLRGV